MANAEKNPLSAYCKSSASLRRSHSRCIPRLLLLLHPPRCALRTQPDIPHPFGLGRKKKKEDQYLNYCRSWFPSCKFQKTVSLLLFHEQPPCSSVTVLSRLTFHKLLHRRIRPVPSLSVCRIASFRAEFHPKRGRESPSCHTATTYCTDCVSLRTFHTPRCRILQFATATTLPCFNDTNLAVFTFSPIHPTCQFAHQEHIRASQCLHTTTSRALPKRATTPHRQRQHGATPPPTPKPRDRRLSKLHSLLNSVASTPD